MTFSVNFELSAIRRGVVRFQFAITPNQCRRYSIAVTFVNILDISIYTGVKPHHGHVKPHYSSQKSWQKYVEIKMVQKNTKINTTQRCYINQDASTSSLIAGTLYTFLN